MALYFLKTYPLAEQAASVWKITRKTWDKWVWVTLCVLYKEFNETEKLINWKDRHYKWTKDNKYPMGVLDCTEYIVQDTKEKPGIFTWKHRSKALKYEIVLHMEQDLILWASGPWTGRTNDQGVFNQQLKNILEQNNEKLVSDSGYKGKYFINALPISSDKDVRLHNWECRAISARLENVNARLKQFLCLKHPWRNQLNRHKIVFFVVLNILQMKLQYQPLRKRNIK